MPTSELYDLVGGALSVLRSRGQEPFAIHEIAEIIETGQGQPLGSDALRDIKEIMLRRWGSGVEPAGIGAEFWKFGYGQPPVSQEIRSHRQREG